MTTRVEQLNGSQFHPEPNASVRIPHALPALAARRVWLNADHPTLSVGRQPALGLVQQSEFIAEGVANPRAPADCDIERRLHGLAAGADKARDRLVNILNQNIGFRA